MFVDHSVFHDGMQCRLKTLTDLRTFDSEGSDVIAADGKIFE